MRINTNVSSITAQEAAVNTNKKISSSLEKLSSGLRINKASDDASGLAIADKLRTQSTSIDQGVSNGNSAVSLLQIADKSMAEQSNILDTVKSKLIQANTDTTSAEGRESIRKDINKLLTQLDNIAKQTNYNGNTLLQASRGDDNASAGLSFQVGESDTDLITNTSIQANTKGLAGSTENLTTGTNDTVAKDSAQIIQGDDFKLDATGGNTLKASIGGKIGSVDATGANMVISNASSADISKLTEMAAANASLTNNGDGTFTLDASSGALDFGDHIFNSITIESTGAAGTLTIDPASSTELVSVQNMGEEVTITGTNAKVGLSLDSLKNLSTDGLTKELSDIYQGVVDDSITQLNSYRGDVGSTQNQVESAVRNLMTQSTNVKAAESIIRDVDYAAESANFNKQNIIAQAGSYAMSQANSVQQNVLRLLQ